MCRYLKNHVWLLYLDIKFTVSIKHLKHILEGTEPNRTGHIRYRYGYPLSHFLVPVFTGVRYQYLRVKHR
ncbi:hypothetical protein HanPI659440_Chr09g0345271 [Helianthus annuus]|nr:hypothetical protein HanPI659440_Chr09g0345271 [Helianthus annuus]